MPVSYTHLDVYKRQANEYARKIAAFLNAQAVITTATDVSHCFAADLFAQKNNYVIQNKEGIARVSAKTLARQNVTAVSYTHLVVCGGVWMCGIATDL